MMMREVEEGAVIAMQPRPKAIPIAYQVKRTLMAAEQSLQPLIANELNVSCSAPSERRDEHRQTVATAPDSREVNLHLTPWVGLEPDQRLRLGHWPQRHEVVLQDAHAAHIA
jgi:hypothetical protein